MSLPALTADFVRSVLSYEPTSGQFYWRGLGRKAAGTPAGGVDTQGYVAIYIGKRKYPAHRLAWVYVTGAWPDGPLDHKDRNRLNNAFANLRKASNSQNCANRSLSVRNTSGVKGVTWNKSSGKWQVTLAKAYIGVFSDLGEASAAYALAAADRYGEFAS